MTVEKILDEIMELDRQKRELEAMLPRWADTPSLQATIRKDLESIELKADELSKKLAKCR